MTRVSGMILLVLFLFSPLLHPLSAQDVDMAFSSEKLSQLGLPEVRVIVGPDGIESPPSLNAGVYLFELLATDLNWAYMEIVIAPPSLDDTVLREHMLLAVDEDLVMPGWTFLGGTNTFGAGVPTVFAIDLHPGDYHIAASYYSPTGSGKSMDLVPLEVTAVETPVADPLPHADVVLEITDDLEFIVTPNLVPAGPQLWKVTNTGEHHHHHVVMFGVPEGTTESDLVVGFLPLFAGQGIAKGSIVESLVPMGYAAIQSGGMTTWNEFNLEPGTYALLCFISDNVNLDVREPHMLQGMVTIFEVA